MSCLRSQLLKQLVVGGRRGSKETRWLCDLRDGEGLRGHGPSPIRVYALLLFSASFYPGIQMSPKKLCKNEKQSLRSCLNRLAFRCREEAIIPEANFIAFVISVHFFIVVTTFACKNKLKLRKFYLFHEKINFFPSHS